MNGIPLQEPRDPGRRTRGRALGVLAILCVFPPLLVINVVQTLSVVLLPFSRPAFRRVNRGCANLWWSLCVVGGRRLYGIRVEITLLVGPYCTG